MDELERLWAEWERAPFPDVPVGLEIDGVDPGLLDSTAAGCISSFIGRRSLDTWRTEILKSCYSEAIKFSERLDGYAGEYFAQLKRLIELVLTELADRPIP